MNRFYFQVCCGVFASQVQLQTATRCRLFYAGSRLGICPDFCLHSRVRLGGIRVHFCGYDLCLTLEKGPYLPGYEIRHVYVVARCCHSNYVFTHFESGACSETSLCYHATSGGPRSGNESRTLAECQLQKNDSTSHADAIYDRWSFGSIVGTIHNSKNHRPANRWKCAFRSLENLCLDLFTQ